MKLVSDKQMTFIRDESKLHTASALFIVFSGIMWIVLAVALILLLMKHYAIGGAMAIIVAIFYVYSETQVNYYEGVKYEFKDNKVIYSYRLNSDVLGSNCKATITLNHINSIKKSGKYIIVKGDIDKKMPLKKVKNVKKIKLAINFGDNTDKLLEMLNNRVEK